MKHLEFWILVIAAIVATMIAVGLCSSEPTRKMRTIENINGTCFDVIVIDSCEYLFGGSGFMAHKGNCKYCEQRQKR